GLNASGRAPKATSPDRFGNVHSMPAMGWGPVTVPGAVSGWVALSKRFGKLPFAKLLEPAIHYATDGFPVAPLTASRWTGVTHHFAEFPELLRVFAPHGHTPHAGDLFANPDAGRSLQLIADSKGEA